MTTKFSWKALFSVGCRDNAGLANSPAKEQSYLSLVVWQNLFFSLFNNCYEYLTLDWVDSLVDVMRESRLCFKDLIVTNGRQWMRKSRQNCSDEKIKRQLLSGNRKVGKVQRFSSHFYCKTYLKTIILFVFLVVWKQFRHGQGAST